MAENPAGAIVDSVGGPANIVSLTHCATRLRFQLHDASGIDTSKVEAIPGVMGAVPQSGDRYQVVIGGAVQDVYNKIKALPEMAEGESSSADAGGGKSDADVKAEMRSKGPRGNRAWLDNFFEFLSDSFRPIIGALLGASLFTTFMALMSTLGVIANWADPRVALPGGWAAVNLMWQGVFTFLPLMIAYNASKKLGADPWVGFGIMGVLMLPGFTSLADVATTMNVFGSEVKVLDVFGLPLTVFGYGSSVFPPLLMAAVLGPLYKVLKRIIPTDLHLIFVPFLAMLIMIPLTAFLIGPIGVYLGAFLGQFLSAINNFSPLIFAIVIPLAYPFMVPLGLHWPINAIMLLNIQTLGYDFIQGPMGAWNFACFGATAGVLLRSIRHHETQMKQTATGALAAGLLGGISEPSLYGIHLRYKRIYPRLLVGSALGGLIIGLGGGLQTQAFVFTSLLTIPAFSNIPLYAGAIAVAFFVSMGLVYFGDYMTPEDRAAQQAELAESDRDAVTAGAATGARGATAAVAAPAAAGAAASASAAPAADAPVAFGELETLPDGERVEVASPLAGSIKALGEHGDDTFASGAAGPGVAIEPSGNVVLAPSDGRVLAVSPGGQSIVMLLDNGVEMLVQVGTGTAAMSGQGFTAHVSAGDEVRAGAELVTFDSAAITAAGHALTSAVVVANRGRFAAVRPGQSGTVSGGDTLITAVRDSADVEV